MDIASGLSAASNGLTIAAWLKKVGKDYDAAEYKMKIAELVDALTEAKLALSEAKEATANHVKEIEALKVSFETKAHLLRGDGDYLYFAGPNDKPLGFPVCPACETNGKIIQLKRNGDVTDTICPKCKSKFKPVTCYLPPEAGDETLKKQNDRLSAEGWGKLNRSLSGSRVV